MVEQMSNLFNDFIVQKYQDEYNDFDNDKVHKFTLAEYLEDWYSGHMMCNVNRRFIDIGELMYVSIHEDNYDLYQYDEDTKTFKEVPFDKDMAWVFVNRYVHDTSEFCDCNNVFVVKYMD
jgi:hypothetical protein